MTLDLDAKAMRNLAILMFIWKHVGDPRFHRQGDLANEAIALGQAVERQYKRTFYPAPDDGETE